MGSLYSAQHVVFRQSIFALRKTYRIDRAVIDHE